jgi:PAS domain-containing protein
MSQQYFQQQNSLFNQSAGSINDFNILNFNINSQQEEFDVTKLPKTRRDNTNSTVKRLYKATLVQRPGERDVTQTGGRTNKNETIGLALARLVKEKHLNGIKYSRDIELLRGIQIKSNTSDFVMVLRTDGRIVAMSDEVEHHLGKSMRSLYTQCINIFQCLDETDGNRLRSILNSSVDVTHQEHRLVCTFRLPKGKRPSRIREDIKTITMAGHFYSCHDASSSSSEKLFVARCEALISRTTNGSSSSQTSMMNNNTNDYTNSMVKVTLNEDMSIHFASSNVKDILGYSRNEMIGHWLGRYLATNDLEKFEAIRQKFFQPEEDQQQAPTSVCDIFDMYGNNGDSRLTFLCQIRPIRERRSKSIKFSVVAQLIDPSLLTDYVKYVELESATNPKPIKAEQVNHVSSSISQTSEDTIVANSPSLDMGLLCTNNNDFNQHKHPSPFHRSLSNVVAPVNIVDESWRQLFEPEYDLFPATTDYQYWSTKFFDDTFTECQSEQELAKIFDEYIDGYYMGGDCC